MDKNSIFTRFVHFWDVLEISVCRATWTTPPCSTPMRRRKVIILNIVGGDLIATVVGKIGQCRVQKSGALFTLRSAVDRIF